MDAAVINDALPAGPASLPRPSRGRVVDLLPAAPAPPIGRSQDLTAVAVDGPASPVGQAGALRHLGNTAFDRGGLDAAQTGGPRAVDRRLV